MARAPETAKSGTSRKRRPRTRPTGHGHRPPVSAEENGTMLPARVSEPASHPDLVQAPPWRPIKNPDATLLGLPIEMRLQIYAYLSDTTMVHVHSPRARTYTWTPCKATNPIYPHLCLNPKWSGLCSESDRCTYKHVTPPEPRGFWALRASSKLLRRETQELVTKNGVFSVNPEDAEGWLDFLKRRAPKQLESITKITLAGPDHYVLSPGYGISAVLKHDLPNLTAVGLQCQTPRYWWISDSDLAAPRLDMVLHWEFWDAVEAMKSFAPTVTCVVEGLVWIKKQKMHDE
ncbi:hypothetical protein CC86DRAFT_316070, partial [Ophiobolus disseminans]